MGGRRREGGNSPRCQGGAGSGNQVSGREVYGRQEKRGWEFPKVSRGGREWKPGKWAGSLWKAGEERVGIPQGVEGGGQGVETE